MPPSKAPSWRQLVTSYAGDAEFAPPATESALATLEAAIGVGLPDDLREFLLEADGVNGVKADYGVGIVWSAAVIEQQNREFRSTESFRELYMPFDHLLFFGDDGGGDLFAYPIQADGEIHNHDIFRWDHETDGREWYAGRLTQFLEKRLRKEDF